MKKYLGVILLSFLFKCASAQSFSQTFTASGNFTIPAGVNSITVEIVGSGGNGDVNGGGGGAGGGYASSQYTVTPGASIPFVIGVPGGGAINGVSSFSSAMFATGGSNAGGSSGGTGGTTTGGNLLNRNGGAGGTGTATYFGGGGGGAGGLFSNGSPGANSIAYAGVCQYPGGAGGNSGGMPGGNGGKGAGFKDAGCSFTDSAKVGMDYGGGGGGGNGIGSTPGTGATGCCVISWTGCVVPALPVNTTPPANLHICSIGNTTVSVSGPGTLTWYTTPSGCCPVYTGSIFVTPIINNTGTYYVEASTCTTSTGRTPVTITVTPTPTITSVFSPAYSCPGQAVIILATGASSYSWSTGAGTYSISVTPSVTTSYTVTGTTMPNCKGTMIITQTVVACTGIKPIITKLQPWKSIPILITVSLLLEGARARNCSC